jgi:prevent-host-death family protein
MPRSVGIREAKASLSALVRSVAVGDAVTITDHGRAVARLVPVSLPSTSLAERMSELERRGWLVKQAGSSRGVPRLRPRHQDLAQRLLSEDRDPRRP